MSTVKTGSVLSSLFKGELNRLERSLPIRFDPDTFNRLHKANKRLKDIGSSVSTVPADVQRRQAIIKFRNEREKMTRADWRLVAWSLNERTSPDQPSVLESSREFRDFRAYVDSLIEVQRLAKRFWAGLAFSYFSFEDTDGDSYKNLQQLGTLLDKGLTSIMRNQRAPRTWSDVADQNRYLFGKNPTSKLADAYLAGDTADFKELNVHVPIVKKSWLWRQLVSSIANLVNASTDSDFKSRIDAMIALRDALPGFEDEVLVTCLTRYSKAKFRDEVHRNLKSVALTQWGSPQLATKAPRWRELVGEETYQMVLSWFAREDLEHFFRLLQGNNQVDHDRLKYWLRFVNQMGFTRILLGPDAQSNRAPDFVDFRERNRGRYGKLAGDKAENNAFIFHIGHVCFIEFSGGGALYAYELSKLPFDLNASTLSSVSDLKHTDWRKHLLRLPHVSYWQQKFDAALAEIGITPGKAISTVSRTRAAVPQANFASVANQSPIARNKTSISVDDAIARGVRLANLYKIQLRTKDLRTIGGCYWILSEIAMPKLHEPLLDLGFKFKASQGYWIK